MNNTGRLIYLFHSRIRVHPHNMRRFYPEEAVAEMAESIRANGGVWQALLVVPDPEREGDYLAVDGNLRLMGAQRLGASAPSLKCELIDAGYAEQLLAMVTTSAFHYPKDPISEALHYRRLAEQGYTARDIAEHTGVCAKTVVDRLRWLDADEPIQELVATGRLPRDRRAADALLSVANTEARLKLAARLANSRASIKAIEAACARLVESMAQQAAAASGAPMVELARQRSGEAAPSPCGDSPGSSTRASWEAVRAAAREMCAACDIQSEVLRGMEEPAWTLISHAAGECCERCPVKGVQAACNSCPGVELLTRLAAGAQLPRPTMAIPANDSGARNGRGH